MRSTAIGLATALAVGAAAQVKLSLDVTQDRRNSFPEADQKLLARLGDTLTITVHLAPEDPRYADLQRNVLAKLERAMPRVTLRLGSGRQGDERYGRGGFPPWGDHRPVRRNFRPHRPGRRLLGDPRPPIISPSPSHHTMISSRPS
jgi:hypothetical protein